MIVELDAAVVVQFLQSGVEDTHPCTTLVMDCLSLIREGWVSGIRHIFREGNRCADFLANFAQACPLGVTILRDPPPDIGPLLDADKIGLAIRRA